jgi:hypothetical protein
MVTRWSLMLSGFYRRDSKDFVFRKCEDRRGEGGKKQNQRQHRSPIEIRNPATPRGNVHNHRSPISLMRLLQAEVARFFDQGYKRSNSSGARLGIAMGERAKLWNSELICGQ